MSCYSNQRHRRSTRLQGYDYAGAGAYFVTVCVHNRQSILGSIVNDQVQLSGPGRMVQECWRDLPRHYGYLEMDAFVVMPNHVHGIIVLCDAPVGAGLKPAHGAGLRPAPTRTYALSEIVCAFKAFSSRRINETRATPGAAMWQRNYFEHVIRDEDELNRVREYILANPAQWGVDRENLVTFP